MKCSLRDTKVVFATPVSSAVCVAIDRNAVSRCVEQRVHQTFYLWNRFHCRLDPNKNRGFTHFYFCVLMHRCVVASIASKSPSGSPWTTARSSSFHSPRHPTHLPPRTLSRPRPGRNQRGHTARPLPRPSAYRYLAGTT